MTTTTSIRCECGNWIAEDGDWTHCVRTVGPRSRFAQGHDAKLKGWLILCGRDDLKVRRGEDGELVDAATAAASVSPAIGSMVTAGIANAKAKKVLQATRLTKKAPAPNRVLVGRWWHLITKIEGEQVTYTTQSGKTKTTTVPAADAGARLKRD